MKSKILLILFLVMASTVSAEAQAKKSSSGTRQETAINKAEDLEQFKGMYTSKDNPDSIVVFVNGSSLMLKIPGQASLPLTATGKNKFRNEKSGVTVEFTADVKQMMVKKDDIVTTYKKADR